MSKLEYTRGAVFYCNLPEFPNVQYSSVEKGWRPVVIVSSLAGNLSSDVVLICPMSTRIKDFSCNVNVDWTADSRKTQVLCNQIMTIPKMALQRPSGHLTSDEMEAVNIAMLISLGIAPSVKSELVKGQEALANAKKDAELLQQLLPQAKTIIQQLEEVYRRVTKSTIKITKKGRIKRSQEDIESFLHEWNDPGNNRNEVAEAFGFNSYSAAYSFAKARTKK